uniref:Putative secreted protein n=1 Tax=Anopheles darlingi TaxID=43151 RepID=A0A2M4DNY0_ANODA
MKSILCLFHFVLLLLVMTIDDVVWGLFFRDEPPFAGFCESPLTFGFLDARQDNKDNKHSTEDEEAGEIGALFCFGFALLV